MGQTIWIARHGNRLDFVNPEWIKTAKRFYDSPLSEDGIVQAQILGQYLKGKGIAHIFASPFRRTLETAHYIAELLDLSVKVESGLSEFLFPLWMPSIAQQFSISELAMNFPRIDLSYTSRVTAKYPEITWQQLTERASKTVKSLAVEFPETMLMVGHEASIVGAIQGLVGSKAKVNASILCCLFQLVKSDSQWCIEPHEYTPNQLINSSNLPITYFQNQIQQRLRSILR